MESLNIPPHNLELETSILSALIFSNEPEIFDLLKPEHFYRGPHQAIYKAAQAVFIRESNLDIKLIAAQLGDDLGRCGGIGYLIKISNEPQPSDNEVYAKKLIGLYNLRKIIEISNAVQKRAFCAQPDETDSVIDYASTELLKLASGRGAEWCKLGDIIVDCIDICEDLQKRQGITGVPSGFRALDFYTCGFQPGDLILIAARPGCGKTSFAINCAKNSGKQGVKNGFMSLEMVRTQIGNRFLSIVSRVNGLKFRSGRFVPEDWERMVDAAGVLSPLPIWIDDSPRSNIIDIVKKSRALKQKEGLDILWIDYLGFLEGDKSQRSKVYEVESITRGLKALAKELSIPAILICQLNRECERRDNKRPMLSDLRDSGALEQDADLVLFFYNDAKYNEDSPDKGIIECEIAKQRNGPTGRIRLSWLEAFTRFDNLQEREE
jgi:replicative DNA helicase